MGLFFNTLDGPLTGKKFIGIIVYLILACISIWATSESLKTSFDVPLFIAYLIGTAFILAMAQLLSIMKDMIEDRRGKIFIFIFIILSFFSLWGVILATNSHKLFTQLKLYDIRKHEMDIAIIELENIENNSRSIGKQVIGDYKYFVTSRIQDYKKEVTNPENRGHGKVADLLKGRVEGSMPGSSFTLPSGRAGDKESSRKLANEMAIMMTDELNTRVVTMEDQLKNLSNCSEQDKLRRIIDSLRVLNNYDTDFSSNKVKQAISDAHEYYNQMYECYSDGLIQSIGSVKEFANARKLQNKLELPVPSIELEKISALKKFVTEYPKEKPGFYINSFWISVLIAFVLDLCSFIIFYFIILKED
jgi:hypothetical protein